MSNIVKSNQTVIAEPFSIERSPEPEMAFNDYLPINHEAVLVPARQKANTILQEAETMVLAILAKAREDSRVMIAEAKEAARLIEVAASEEAESARESALGQGYQEGLSRAALEMQAKMDQAREEKIRILEDAQRERLEIISTSEEVIVKIVLAVAKKVIDKEVMDNPDITKNIVSKIVEHLSDGEAFKIFLSPRDFEYLAEELARNQLSQSGGKLQIKSDSRIADGGCIIDTDLGIVDARLETRVMAVENALLEGVEREPVINE